LNHSQETICQSKYSVLCVLQGDEIDVKQGGNEIYRLAHRLKNDLNKIGLELYCPVVIKDYSLTYYGYYNIRKDEVVLFLYTDPKRKYWIDYSELLEVAIHELIHCKYYKVDKRKRYKGIIHDAEFLKQYNFYVKKAEKVLKYKNQY
jgi:hypothetical protein